MQRFSFTSKYSFIPIHLSALHPGTRGLLPNFLYNSFLLHSSPRWFECFKKLPCLPWQQSSHTLRSLWDTPFLKLNPFLCTLCVGFKAQTETIGATWQTLSVAALTKVGEEGELAASCCQNGTLNQRPGDGCQSAVWSPTSYSLPDPQFLHLENEEMVSTDVLSKICINLKILRNIHYFGCEVSWIRKLKSLCQFKKQYFS